MADTRNNPFSFDAIEILPDQSVKINGALTKANIISIEPGSLGRFRVKLELSAFLTAAPPNRDGNTLETIREIIKKSGNKHNK